MAINISEVSALYSSGLSSRQIAAKLGISKSYIARICKQLGLSRSHSMAAQLRQPQKSKHWRTCRSNARKRMERHLGRKLKRDEHVHHINGDYTDNRLENLEVMDALAHAYHHRPANPIPRWQRPERKAYMKKYLKTYMKDYRRNA